MNSYLIGLGLVATLSLVGCSQVREGTPITTITPDQPMTANNSTPQPTSSGKVAAIATSEPAQLWREEGDEQITVHSSPASESNAVYTGKKGDNLQAMDATRDSSGQIWYFVKLPSETEGWVQGQYIRFITGDPLARPQVVMPGSTWILAEPRNDAAQIGEVKGGEIISASERVEENGNTWFYNGKGWISGEFLFQPACLSFNGNPMMVVKASGAKVLSEPNAKASESDRLEGGDTLYPIRHQVNGEGHWVYIERGWINTNDLFYPACPK